MTNPVFFKRVYPHVVADAVRQYVAANPGATGPEIKAKIGRNPDSVHSALTRLVKIGEIQRTKSLKNLRLTHYYPKADWVMLP